jgi:hypothetical protein
MNHLPLLTVLATSTLVTLGAESLVLNGDFEQPARDQAAAPLGWDRPDGLGVQWTNAPDPAHGKAIRLNTAVSEKAMVQSWQKTGLSGTWNIPNPADNAVAETYGLSFYSAAIPVKPGQPYKVTFDYLGPSGGAKLWVRGWGLFQGEKRRRWETTVECRVANPRAWTTISQEFFPTRSRPEVNEMKVMLYAFFPAGVYWFDNVKIEPITLEEYERLRKAPAPAAHGRK